MNNFCPEFSKYEKHMLDVIKQQLIPLEERKCGYCETLLSTEYPMYYSTNLQICKNCYESKIDRCNLCGNKGTYWYKEKYGAICKSCYKERIGFFHD